MTAARTQTLAIGHRTVTYSAHYIDGVGARVIVTIEDGHSRHTFNWTPDDLRLFNAHGTIAACEADALARRTARQKGAA